MHSDRITPLLSVRRHPIPRVFPMSFPTAAYLSRASCGLLFNARPGSEDTRKKMPRLRAFFPADLHVAFS